MMVDVSIVICQIAADGAGMNYQGLEHPLPTEEDTDYCGD